MHKSIKAIFIAIFLTTFAALTPAVAAGQNAGWEAQVRKADETYWHDFNFGTSAALNSHLTADVEFYHDLGGALLGYEALAGVNAGIENNKNRLRRVIVPGTLRIFPMRLGPDIYGAIVMGDHDFFSTESGKVIKKSGRASFSHLMLLKDGAWKVARIYSYNHQPAKSAKK